MFNKVLANQIQKHIKTITHYEQLGVNLGMQDWFNIQKYINVMHHIKKIKDQKHTIGSIDVDDKNPQKTSNLKEFLQSDKWHPWKTHSLQLMVKDRIPSP